MPLEAQSSGQLYGPDGRLLQPEPDPLPAQPGARPQVVAYPVFDRAFEHPGRRLTLRKILRAYDRADMGDPDDMCDLFDDRLQVDAHLWSQFDTREGDCVRKPWVILEGGDADADKDAARKLTERLEDVANLMEAFEWQSFCNRYGWSGSEIKWERVAGLVAPTWFVNVPHRRFRFDDNDRPLLRVPGSIYGEPLRPGSWWFTRRTGTNTTAAGLMRIATIVSWIKSGAFRDWVVWSNRYGIPFVSGTYDDGPDGADEDERAVLRKAVKSLGTDGWAIYSKACDIVITETAKGGKAEDVHGALCSFCNQELSKLITGATQNVETGTAGSYAQAEVHADRAFNLVAGDATRLAMSFRQAIAMPFVRWNNLNARPPRLEFRVVRDMSPTSRAKVFAIARNDIGVALDADQVRHELQLRKPTGESLDPPVAAPAPGPGPGDEGEDDDDDDA